jgi:hypothetical protein
VLPKKISSMSLPELAEYALKLTEKREKEFAAKDYTAALRPTLGTLTLSETCMISPTRANLLERTWWSSR